MTEIHGDLHTLRATAAPGENSTLIGTSGNDRLYGGDGRDYLELGGGDDVGYGGGGDDNVYDWGGGADTVYGGTGNDYLDGGAGDDLMVGGEGVDTAFYWLAANPTDDIDAGVRIDLNIKGPQDTGGSGWDTLEGIESVIGSQDADHLTGDAGANVFSGQSGDDTILGGGGDDRIIGTDGAYNRGTLERDLLVGGGGDDVIIGHTYLGSNNRSDATLLGGAGNDTLDGGQHQKGGAGADVLDSDQQNATLKGGDGDDRIIGGFGVLDGGAGADTIRGAGAISGRDGDDIVTWTAIGGTPSSASGGEGFDSISVSALGSLPAVHLDLGSMAGGAKVWLWDGNWIAGFEAGDIRLSNGNDWISLGATQFDVDGGAGSDTIIGGVYGDVLTGSGGLDVVSGEGGDDRITGYRGDVLDGGAGLDAFHLMLTSYPDAVAIDVDLTDISSSTVVFQDGTSLGHFETGELILSDADNRVVIGDHLITIQAGAGDDTLTGSELDDSLSGGGGSDRLVGLGGDDWLSALVSDSDAVNFMDGGDGDDHLVGGYGDTLIGGAGVDAFELTLDSPTALVDVDLSLLTQGVFQLGPTQVSGFEGGFVRLSFRNDKVTVGSALAIVDASGGDDTVNGGALDDEIHVGDGKDTVRGGAGDDRLFGDTNDDRIVGNAGADMLSGWFGADTFVFFAGDSTVKAPDVITDLDDADRIELSQVSPDTLHLVTEFTGQGNEVAIAYQRHADRTLLSVDIDGDRATDLRVVISGDHRDFTNFVF
jgi:Ca2+-binding RTX toxin-like protein